MKKSNKSLYLTALLAVLILIGIGYAALTATLNINGQTEIKKQTWDVHFENIRTSGDGASSLKFYNSTDTSHTTPLTELSKVSATSLDYTLDLYNSSIAGSDGGWYGHKDVFFLVDVVNRGTIPAKFSSVVLPYIDSKFQHFLKVTCMYNPYPDSYGNPDDPYYLSWNLSQATGAQNSDIAPGERKTIGCKHEWLGSSELTQSDIEAFSSMPSSSMIIPLSLNLGFSAK